MKRTQIYVEEEQDRRLAARAAELGVTKSALIRTAVDELLAGTDADGRLEAFRDALEATAGSVESLSSGAEYVADLRRSDIERMETSA